MRTDKEITIDEQVFKALGTMKLLRLRIGLRGNTFLDAGFVFAPYIPVQITSTIDTNDFQSVKTLFKK